MDFRYAVGASLVSVIATSSGAAAAYVREGFTNIRIGMLLEVATTVGALVGAYLAGLHLHLRSRRRLRRSCCSIRRTPRAGRARSTCLSMPDPLATRLRLDGTYPIARR